MNGNNAISNDQDPKISINIMPGETVNSIFQRWKEKYFDSQTEIDIKFMQAVESIKGISPKDVENKMIPEELSNFITEINGATVDRPEILEDLFNSLNLCVVGLGTRLKLNNNE